MAKKNKKKKPVQPEVKFKRKIKKYTRRLMWIMLAAIGYFILLPKLVPSYAPQVEQSKATLIAGYQVARQEAEKVLGSAAQLTAQLTSTKEELEEKGPEAIVQEKVNELKEQVKALPKEQIKKVKSQFCSDLIQEATQACEVTKTTQEVE